MKPLFIRTAIVGLLVTMVSLPSAATNLNSSKSNVYRVIYHPHVVSSAQASALLAELDKLGQADEATLKKWLSANFRKHGVQAERIKKVVVLPPTLRISGEGRLAISTSDASGPRPSSAGCGR